MSINWDRLTPAQRAAYEDAEVVRMERQANLDSLKMLKELRRSIVQDAQLNGFEPEGLDEVDEMIERVVGRLT